MAQAELQLRLYDLRREAKLRRAREWFLANFVAATMDDVQRIAPSGSRQNAWMRMSCSYWEQACQMLECGLLHEDLFFQTSAEPWLFWERLKPAIGPMRASRRNPHAYENLEAAALRFERWAKRRSPGFVEALRASLQQQPVGSSTGAKAKAKGAAGE